MPFKGSHTGAHSDIPELTGAIDRTGGAVLPCKLKQGATDLLGVTFKDMNWLPDPGIPDDRGLVEGTGQYHVPVGVEMQGN